jgi:hypothetical protein
MHLLKGNTNGCCNNDNYVYMDYPIQVSQLFELSFALRIENGWVGDSFSIFIGYDDMDTESTIVNSHGYSIVFNFYEYPRSTELLG